MQKNDETCEVTYWIKAKDNTILVSGATTGLSSQDSSGCLLANGIAHRISPSSIYSIYGLMNYNGTNLWRIIDISNGNYGNFILTNMTTSVFEDKVIAL